MILDIAMVVLFSGTTAFLIALNVWNYPRSV